jgi:hypothetical protein
MVINYCINCKHYTLQETDKAHMGKCLMSQQICLVTGTPKTYDELSYCSTMRIGKCGYDADLFEPKA